MVELSNLTQSSLLKLLSDGTAEIVSRVSKSVVTINAGTGRGSGIVWNSEGMVITCNHVIGNNEKIRVGQYGVKQVEAKIIGQDRYSDVAVLSAEGLSLPQIEVGKHEELSVGQLVLAIANPYNRRASATMGIVTSFRVPMRGTQGMRENMIFTDAKLSPGYSGGPLVDASGKMIGLNSAYMDNRGIAISVEAVKDSVERIIKHGSLKRAHLGLVTNNIELPSEIAGNSNIDQDSAIIVFSTESESPARQAGVLLGDIILGFNEKPVRNTYDLLRLLGDDIIGKSIKMKILRAEKIHEILVQLDSYDSNDD
ncbi:serine protease [Candidatus Bathyarchaeota archaeon]|nr:serine protease [Candidatus Bathyarchaeota archaeon]